MSSHSLPTGCRAHVTPQEKQWDVIGIARGLAPAVRCFADSVDPAKLDPTYVAAIKSFGQLSGNADKSRDEPSPTKSPANAGLFFDRGAEI